MFFAMRPERAVLSDLNAELMSTYAAIRDSWREVWDELKRHHDKHSKPYYYTIRSSIYEDSVRRAARFLYLNRTCWNGLYRVNSNNAFNVPIGTKTNVILEGDDFEKAAALLQSVELRTSDFEEVIDEAADGDLVFADPPYTVVHNQNGFVKYNEKMFSWSDQIRLRDACVRARDRGATLYVTNAFHPSVLDLYDGLGLLTELRRYSVIGGGKAYRRETSELGILIGGDR